MVSQYRRLGYGLSVQNVTPDTIGVGVPILNYIESGPTREKGPLASECWPAPFAEKNPNLNGWVGLTCGAGPEKSISYQGRRKRR